MTLKRHIGITKATTKEYKKILEDLYEGKYIESPTGCKDPCEAIKLLEKNLYYREEWPSTPIETTVWDFYHMKLTEEITNARVEICKREKAEEKARMLEKKARKLEKRVDYLEVLISDLTGDWPEDIEEFEVE